MRIVNRSGQAIQMAAYHEDTCWTLALLLMQGIERQFLKPLQPPSVMARVRAPAGTKAKTILTFCPNANVCNEQEMSFQSSGQ